MNGRLACLALLAALTGCLPVTGAVTSARLVEPASLPSLPSPVLVDLRPADEFERGHLAKAVNLRFEEVPGYLHRVGGRGERPLVLICGDGLDATLAFPSAALHGFPRAYVLSGGMDRWRSLGLPEETGRVGLDVDSTALPMLDLSLVEQVVAFVAGLILKPTYMILALVLIARLRSRMRGRALRLLWHGLLWFLVGELCCAADMAWHPAARIWPFNILHGAGMVALSLLVPWGLWTLFDERVLRFSAPSEGCRVQALCGRCWKRDPVRCVPHDLMMVLAPALGLVSLLPLTVPLRPLLVAAKVLGSVVELGVPVIDQIVELRLYPVAGAVLLLVTPFLLRGGPPSLRRAEGVFYAGFGFAAYALLRFVLTYGFEASLAWSNFWEELTELFLIVGIALFLLFFRRQLGLTTADAAAGPPA